MLVARDGPTAIARLLIQHNADIDVQDKYGCTTLHGTALRGYEPMLKLLLEHEANTNAENIHDWTPRHMAALRQYQKPVQFLLEKINNGIAALDFGLLSNSERKRSRNYMRTSQKKKVEESTVLTGLRLAIQERHFARLQLMPGGGTDANEKDAGGSIALMIAASNGYNEVVQLLLQNGADISKSGLRGRPPLLWTYQSGEAAAVRLLVEIGQISTLVGMDGHQYLWRQEAATRRLCDFWWRKELTSMQMTTMGEMCRTRLLDLVIRGRT